MDKGRRWVEDSIHHTRRVIQANSNVFWTYKFTSNVSDHDEWNSVGSHQHWKSGKFYRWCDNRDRNRERTWQDSGGSSEEIGREWLVYKTRKVQVKSQGSKFLKSSDRTRGNQDRGRKSERYLGLTSSKRG